MVERQVASSLRVALLIEIIRMKTEADKASLVVVESFVLYGDRESLELLVRIAGEEGR